MNRLVDDKGRIFGKINIIDFLVILTVLILIPAFVVSQEVIRKSLREIPLFSARGRWTTYDIKRYCPNCQQPIDIRIKKGRPSSEVFPYTTICEYCGVEVTIEE